MKVGHKILPHCYDNDCSDEYGSIYEVDGLQRHFVLGATFLVFELLVEPSHCAGPLHPPSKDIEPCKSEPNVIELLNELQSQDVIEDC